MENQENVNEEIKLNAEVTQRNIDFIPMVDAEDDEDKGLIAGIPLSNQVSVEAGKMYINPETGETVDGNSLSVLDKLKMIGKELGQTLDDPDPSCKKCYGRGYDGFTQNGLPRPCNCMYKTFFKENPHWRGRGLPSMNRKARRQRERDMQRQNKFRAKYVEEITRKTQENIAKSKANLGKNTPGYIPKALREVEGEAGANE